MLPSTLFSLPADTEVIAPGEVLRRRNEVLTTVLHLESGRVLRGVLDDGFLRHQLGAVEGPFWLDAASALMGMPFPVDMVADTRLLDRGYGKRLLAALPLLRKLGSEEEFHEALQALVTRASTTGRSCP